MCGRIVSRALATVLVFCTWQAKGQDFDPRPSLATLVSAFQYCGPPQAYQLLSPYLFNLVAQQTAGKGCYNFIAAAGPITGMRVIDSAAFPEGPLYVVRVTHGTGPVDWFIGFDRISSKVIYLTFQSVTKGASPSIKKGADRSGNLGLVKPPSKPAKDDDTDDDTSDPDDKRRPDKKDNQSAACKKFPLMCP